MHDNLPPGAADNPSAPFNQSDPFLFFYICPNQFPVEDERMVDDPNLDEWLDEEAAMKAARHLAEMLGYPVKVEIYANSFNDIEGADYYATITVGIK